MPGDPSLAASAATSNAKRAAAKKGSGWGERAHEKKSKRGRSKGPVETPSPKRTLDAWVVRDKLERAPLRSLSPDVPIGKEVPARGRQSATAVTAVHEAGEVRSTSPAKKPSSRPTTETLAQVIELDSSPSPKAGEASTTGRRAAGKKRATPPAASATTPGGSPRRGSRRSPAERSSSPQRDPADDIDQAARAVVASASSTTTKQSSNSRVASRGGGSESPKAASAKKSNKTKVGTAAPRGTAKGADTFTRRGIKAKGAPPSKARNKSAATAAEETPTASGAADETIPSAGRRRDPPRGGKAPTGGPGSPATLPAKQRAVRVATSATTAVQETSVTSPPSPPPPRAALSPRRASTRIASDCPARPSSPAPATAGVIPPRAPARGAAAAAAAAIAASARPAAPAAVSAGVKKPPAPKLKVKKPEPAVRRFAPLVSGAGGGGGWAKKGEVGGSNEEETGMQRGSAEAPPAVEVSAVGLASDEGGGTSGASDGPATAAGDVAWAEAGAGAKDGGVDKEVAGRPEKRCLAEVDAAASSSAADDGATPAETTPAKKQKIHEAAPSDSAENAELCAAAAEQEEGLSAGGSPGPEIETANKKERNIAATGGGADEEASAESRDNSNSDGESSGGSGNENGSRKKKTKAGTPSPKAGTPSPGGVDPQPSTPAALSPGSIGVDKSPTADSKGEETGGKSRTPLAGAEGRTAAAVGESAAVVAEAPAPKPQKELPTHVMIGGVLQMRCKVCKTRLGRAGCTTGSCLDCCFKSALPCAAHAKKLERKRLEAELLAAGPSNSQLREEQEQRNIRGLFRENAFHAIGDTATVWCFLDFLCARSNHAALTTLSRTQRATAGRDATRSSRMSSGGSSAAGKREEGAPSAGPSSPTGDSSSATAATVSGGKARRVRPAIARWQRKNMEMLAALGESGSSPLSVTTAL